MTSAKRTVQRVYAIVCCFDWYTCLRFQKRVHRSFLLGLLHPLRLSQRVHHKECTPQIVLCQTFYTNLSYARPFTPVCAMLDLLHQVETPEEHTPQTLLLSLVGPIYCSAWYTKLRLRKSVHHKQF